MSILSEVAKACEKEYVRTGRIPFQARVPRVKYKKLLDEMRGCLRMPPREEVYGLLSDGTYGWRLETAEEYTKRINEPPVNVTLTLTTGTLNIRPSDGDDIEVMLESTN